MAVPHPISDAWFGVFAPDGELEAVEATRGLAEASAIQMSPKVSGVPQVNRRVAPVTVVVGSFDAILADCLTSAARTVAGRHSAVRHHRADAEAADKQEAARDKSMLPANYWHDSHRAALLASLAESVVAALEGR